MSFSPQLSQQIKIMKKMKGRKDHSIREKNLTKNYPLSFKTNKHALSSIPFISVSSLVHLTLTHIYSDRSCCTTQVSNTPRAQC